MKAELHLFHPHCATSHFSHWNYFSCHLSSILNIISFHHVFNWIPFYSLNIILYLLSPTHFSFVIHYIYPYAPLASDSVTIHTSLISWNTSYHLSIFYIFIILFCCCSLPFHYSCSSLYLCCFSTSIEIHLWCLHPSSSFTAFILFSLITLLSHLYVNLLIYPSSIFGSCSLLCSPSNLRVHLGIFLIYPYFFLLVQPCTFSTCLSTSGTKSPLSSLPPDSFERFCLVCYLWIERVPSTFCKVVTIRKSI